MSRLATIEGRLASRQLVCKFCGSGDHLYEEVTVPASRGIEVYLDDGGEQVSHDTGEDDADWSAALNEDYGCSNCQCTWSPLADGLRPSIAGLLPGDFAWLAGFRVRLMDLDEEAARLEGWERPVALELLRLPDPDVNQLSFRWGLYVQVRHAGVWRHLKVGAWSQSDQRIDTRRKIVRHKARPRRRVSTVRLQVTAWKTRKGDGHLGWFAAGALVYAGGRNDLLAVDGRRP